MARAIVCFAATFSIIVTAFAQDKHVLFHEDFNNMEDWRPLYFKKDKKPTMYKIESYGDESYLKAESDASASGLIYKKEFNVYEYPKVAWRWKINSVYRKADPKTKTGDDYPIRVYVMFKYEPEKSSAFEKLQYELSRQVYGEYPPHSSLSYVWANREYNEAITVSPYTEKTIMIFLEMGEKNAGKWQSEEINIVEDYERVFGVKPPPIATLGIMNDSDNTGERSVSFVDYIMVYR